MIIRIGLIILFFLFASPVVAESGNYDFVEVNKFVELYRKFFEKEIVANLSASRAELNAVIDKRNLILDYMYNNNLNINEDEVNQAWQGYIKKNFKTIDEFAVYLEASFIKEFELKERFKQNLYFSKYFGETIVPRIKRDFDLRKKIFEIAESEKITINQNEFQEALFQMAENWGGMDQFSNFLNRNNISFTDISFYIKSEQLKNKFLEKYFDQKLKTDTELAIAIENSALNEYNILNQKHYPLYYFRHAFISSECIDADKKIQDYYHEIQKNSFSKLETIPNSDVKVENVSIFIDPNSELIASDIKKIVIDLSNDELFVDNKISSIIKKNNFYHIFQLVKIVIPENEDLHIIKHRKLQELKSRFDIFTLAET